MDSSTIREYEYRIQKAIANKDIDELRIIRDELETYRDPDAKKLIYTLTI